MSTLFHRIEQKLAALEALSVKRGTLFWTLHSIWALATGVVVVIVAHEEYGFVPWVFAMLAMTWASTVFFLKRSGTVTSSSMERFSHGVASYFTRVMYQETLFFLLPFYAYSVSFVPVPAWNVVFLILLVGLAVLSCLDQVFDRILRASPLFALLFFSSVAFAALNLILPIIASIRLDQATTAAAWLAFFSSLLISFRGRRLFTSKALIGMILGASLTWGVPQVAWIAIPPVPLRLQEVVFAMDIEQDSLNVIGELKGGKRGVEYAGNQLVAVVRIFAPVRFPVEAQLTWDLDGQRIKEAKKVEIEGHSLGFRVWSVFTPESGQISNGLYRLSVMVDGRLLGQRQIYIAPVSSQTDTAGMAP